VLKRSGRGATSSSSPGTFEHIRGVAPSFVAQTPRRRASPPVPDGRYAAHFPIFQLQWLSHHTPNDGYFILAKPSISEGNTRAEMSHLLRGCLHGFSPFLKILTVVLED